jgi:hypothetical protein
MIIDSLNFKHIGFFIFTFWSQLALEYNAHRQVRAALHKLTYAGFVSLPLGVIIAIRGTNYGNAVSTQRNLHRLSH